MNFGKDFRIPQILLNDHDIVPLELRAEFRREMSFANVQRMTLVSSIILIVSVLLIITVDTFNLLHLSAEMRLTATILHFFLGSSAAFLILLARRFKNLDVAAMLPFHYRISVLLPSFLLILPTILIYYIAINVGQPSTVYLAVLMLWSAGLLMEFRFALVIIVINFIAFHSMMRLAINTLPTIDFGIEAYISTTMGTIAVLLAMKLGAHNSAISFVQRKQVEVERNRIALLNDEIAAAYEEAEVLNNNLTQTLRALESERQVSEQLLLNILPESIAVRMKSGETTIAEHFEQVTVLFADIVGFTNLSATMKPAELVSLLDRLFTEFDVLAQQFGVEKIKTIGDAYMAVCGIPHPTE